MLSQVTESKSLTARLRDSVQGKDSKIAPYDGYVIEVADAAIHDQAMANASGVVNAAAVLKAESQGMPGSPREIWLGCEHLGDVPYDYEGSFHWGFGRWRSMRYARV